MQLAPGLQAAGHEGCEVAGPVFIKSTTPQELDFYNELQDSDSAVDGSVLSHWMPVMMGTLTAGNLHHIEGLELPVATEGAANVSAKDGLVKIVLQNLYHGFSQPSILDIKLGKVLTDELTAPEKRERLANVARNTTTGSLGLRVCGMKVWGQHTSEVPEIYSNILEHVEEKDGYLSFNKFFGRSVTDATIKDALMLFFAAAPSHRRHELINRFHQRLQLLYNCLLDLEVRIFSGSLLFIYESDPERWNNIESYESADPLLAGLNDDDSDDETNPNTPLSRLNMIDFAHATHTKGRGYDENLVDGVENLIGVFDRMLLQ